MVQGHYWYAEFNELSGIISVAPPHSLTFCFFATMNDPVDDGGVVADWVDIFTFHFHALLSDLQESQEV